MSGHRIPGWVSRAARLISFALALVFASCTLTRSGAIEQTCSSVVDCDDGTACTTDECSPDGMCVHTPVDATGSIVQVPFDCRMLFCENGRELSEPDDGDVPVEVCTDSACSDGELFEDDKRDGTLCSEGQGTGTCQDGACIIVCDPDDPQSVAECDDDNPCTIDSCDVVSKICVRETLNNIESSEPDDAHNCRVDLCTRGVEQNVADDEDLPIDGEPCTVDKCDGGAPLYETLPEGTACGPNGQLPPVCNASGHCVDCNVAGDCAGQDDFCQVRTCINEVCGVDNTPNNTPLPPSQQNAGPCKEVQCDGSGGTKIVNHANGTTCNDGVFCNGPDTCLGGNCSQHAGDPCPGPDGDGDCSESCNEASDSCTLPDPNGTVCNDAIHCNGTDTCNAGTCSVHTGNPCPGPDGDGDCAESCDETGDSCTLADPNGASCTDSVFCNGPDACQNGGCAVHAGNPCPGPDGDGDCTETCDETNDNCNGVDPNGSLCTDGTFCNGTETCLTGSCSNSTGNPCGGHNVGPACNDSCNEPADNCTAPDALSTLCSDGAFCTTADTCNGTGQCVGVGNPCPGHNVGPSCNDSCNEAGDNCAGNDASATTCSDGAFCTTIDSCNGAGSCLGAGNPCPGHNVGPSCNDSCNEAADNCSAGDVNSTPCSDGAFCNGSETCSSGVCTNSSGNPCPGHDAPPSCVDSCNESGDNCSANDLDGTSCGPVLNCAMGMCVSGCGDDLLPPGGTQCPSGCDGCDFANRICFIDCTGAGECSSMTLSCPSSWACEVSCSGNGSCQNATVACPSLYACEIGCSANGACQGMVVGCPTEGSCNLSCTSGNSSTCANAQLNCVGSLNECVAACTVGGPVTANCPLTGMCACNGC